MSTKVDKKKTTQTSSISKDQLNQDKKIKEGAKEITKEDKNITKTSIKSTNPSKKEAKSLSPNKDNNNVNNNIPNDNNKVITLDNIISQSRKEILEMKKKQIDEDVRVAKEKSNKIDKKNISKLDFTCFFEDKNEPYKFSSLSNEIFFDFKKKVFNDILKLENENNHNIYLANKIITDQDNKMLFEIFQKDFTPIIQVKQKININKKNTFHNKSLTKVSVKYYPTVNELFCFLDNFLEKNKYPKTYKEEIKNGLVIISFDNSDAAYGFLKAINYEKIKNQLFSKIETSIFAESQLKHPEMNYLSNRLPLYSSSGTNVSHHVKKYNAYSGVYKNSVKGSLNNHVSVVFYSK